MIYVNRWVLFQEKIIQFWLVFQWTDDSCPLGNVRAEESFDHNVNDVIFTDFHCVLYDTDYRKLKIPLLILKKKQLYLYFGKVTHAICNPSVLHLMSSFSWNQLV